MPEMSGFSFYREIKKRDDKMKVCFLTAGEMYYGSYSDIFSSLPANCFIRKPITNEELLKHMDRSNVWWSGIIIINLNTEMDE